MIDTQYYITRGIDVPTVKLTKPVISECTCGNLLPYRTSPFMTAEKRICPKCGKIHSGTDEVIDWKRNFDTGRERRDA